MPSYLLLYPILDVLKTPARLTYPKVVYPASELWVDNIYRALHWLRDKALENVLQIMQEFCPRLHSRSVEHSPFATPCSFPLEVKSKKAEFPPFLQVYQSGLFLINCYIKLYQLFTVQWPDINWAQCIRTVRRLQVRIVKASAT